MVEARVEWDRQRDAADETPRGLRAIAPHAPTARDLIGLYATRVQATGADVLPALRARRAVFVVGKEPVGFLATTVAAPSRPVPVGRGTATHRQALEALSASQWATQRGGLPEPEGVRVTRAHGAVGRGRAESGWGEPAFGRYGVGPGRHAGLIGRLGAACRGLARLEREADQERDFPPNRPTLEAQSA